MVAAENVIEKTAHHFLVYGCADNEFTRKYTQTQEYFSPERSGANEPRTKCTSFFHVWAAGRGPFILRQNVGFSMTEESSMIMLETHNDNPDFSTNTRDSSCCVNGGRCEKVLLEVSLGSAKPNCLSRVF